MKYVVRNSVNGKAVAKFKNYSDMLVFMNTADPFGILFYHEEI